MDIDKSTIIILILGTIFLVLSGILVAGKIITPEVFVSIALLIVLIPLGRLFLPVIHRALLRKRVLIKDDVFGVWQKVYKKLNETTRVLPNMTETYIPHRHLIIKELGIYVCQIDPDDLRKDGLIPKMEGEKRLIVYDLDANRIIWEDDFVDIVDFLKNIHDYRWIFSDSKRALLPLPTEIITQKFAEGRFVGV